MRRRSCGWGVSLGLAALVAAPGGSAQTVQVRGVPFAATQVITRTSAAGTTRTEGRIARRTDGSTYVEEVDPGTGAAVRVLIVDVPGKRLIRLDLRRRQYQVSAAPGLAAETVPVGSADDMLRWSEAHRSVTQQDTQGAVRSRQMWLGTRRVGGLLTIGTLREQREDVAAATASLAGAASGTALRTDESWFSVDLNMAVLMTEHRPTTGETIEVLLTRILRTEPDAELFAIPQGFSPEPIHSAPRAHPSQNAPSSDG